MLHNVSLNASMRANLLSLQQTSKLQDITSNRLSTGLKVNSAIDNPSAYYTAQSLSDRASDLNALLDAISQGIQTLKAVAETIDAATGFLQQAKAVASQALETAQNIAARVSTEEELLAAVSSGKKGLIILEKDIAMSTNQSIRLQDGQSLVGARYIGESSRYATLSFNISGQKKSGIYTANGNMISDLNINYTIDKNLGSAAIMVAADAQSTLRNLNIKIESGVSDAEDVSCWGIYVQSGSVSDISGTVNIFAPQEGNAGRRIYGICGKGTFNVTNRARLNILTKGTLGFGISLAQVNLLANSEVNISSTSYPILSQPSVMNGISLLDSSARLNLKSSNPSIFYGSNGTDGDFIISAVRGAQINANGKLFTALENTDKIMVMKGNSLNNSFNGNDNKFSEGESSSSVTTLLDSIFADFEDFMQRSETSSARSVNSEVREIYDNILDQYDALINDGSYKGVNLLRENNLKLSFNENGSSSLTIAGVNASSEKLGITKNSWQDEKDIEETILQLENAVASLRDFAARFGTYNNIVTTRQEFTEAMINVLEEGADKLTLADMNQESANMLALQTRQMLAVNALALSSRTAKAVLSLF